ncbi:hypothetical protein SC206_18395 [Rouxiella sp. T17]|uniref:hypothetical protein n=1 Tax=Rouxiella sp. T17 TaxID=3085684 RepID=UPI002FCC1E77
MLDYHDNTRSMQTIRTNTAVIDSFPLNIHNIEDAVEVRRMLSRESANRQHFIVTLKSDVDRAEKISNSTSLIKPLTEVVVRGTITSFIFNVAEQHPDLISFNDDISSKIKRSVESFMKTFGKMDNNDPSLKLVNTWCRL